mgnify:CR=1 FL=1
MNIVNDILVNTLFPDTDFVQTLSMNSVVPKYVENQEKGNPCVCKNCAEAPFRDLHIYGRSEQVTTTGAQLLDLTDLIGKTETKNGATYKINEDQSISVSGTPTEYTSFYLKRISLKAGSYYFTNNSNSNNVFAQLIGTKVNANRFTLDEDSDIIDAYVVFSVLPNNTESFDTTFVTMLNAGDTALPWEPYTGGKPSPSPDYPQEIVSAGDDGSIGVEVHGKNLLGGRFYYAQYSSGILYINRSQKDEEVKFPYQPRNETYGVCKVIKCQKGKNYVISVTNPNKNAVTGMAEYETIEKAIDVGNALGFAKMDSGGSTKSYIAKSDGILVCGIAGKWTNGSTTTHECTESELLQVEEASEATSYEPYHEPQSMSVTTPNGLPGIPVTSGGNYTDENGQQWICDEVDFGRGVYVQRVYTVEVDGVNVYFSQEEQYCNMSLRGLPLAKFKRSQTVFARSTFTSVECNVNPKMKFLYFVAKNYADAINESAKVKPGKVMYALEVPIETPLTASEIAAYKSLRTYKGTTIVEAEDKAGISVKYNMPMPKLSKNGALRRWFKRHPII